MAISVAQARQICTPAELDLVLQSTTRQIGSLDPKQLRSSIRRARTLRDKWRDRAASQTRDTKSQNPDRLGEANARSNDKAQLFDEALGRFEKRLSKVDGATNGSAAATKAKPAKQTRTGEHRATRSSVRSTLSKKAEKLNADDTAPSSSPATSPATVASDATVTAGGDGSAKPAGKRTVAKKGATPKASAKRKGPPKRKAPPRSSNAAVPAAAAPVAQGLAAAAMAAGRDGGEGGEPSAGSTKKRSSKAKPAAKATAVKPGGSPRMPGKVASQGRRSQAKRGSR